LAGKVLLRQTLLLAVLFIFLPILISVAIFSII
jgi:hypothetical protein